MDNKRLQIILKEFSFLVENYGFEATETGSGMTYICNDNTIRISYDYYSFEISIYFENKTFDESFDIGDIFKYFNSNYKSGYQVGDILKFEHVLHNIAHNLKLYIPKLIKDNNIFKAIKIQVNDGNKKYALKQQLECIRRDSFNAWKNKDYKKIIELFSPITEYLSLSELKKLDYAKKEIKS